MAYADGMKIVGIIVGGLIALFALPLIGIGVAIVGWVGDGDGLNIPIRGLDAPPKVIAIVSPTFSATTSDLPSQIRDSSVTFHVTPQAGSAPIFIGLAAAANVDRYLKGATTAQLENTGTPADTTAQTPAPQDVISGDGTQVQLHVTPGPRTHVPPPATRRFWIRQADSATGDITLKVADLDGKDLRVVVMRTDGRPGMAVDASMKFHVPFLPTVGWWMLGIGLAIAAVGVGLMIWMIILLGRPRRRPLEPAATAPAAPAPTAPTTPSQAAPAADTTARPAVDTTPAPPPTDDAPAD